MDLIKHITGICGEPHLNLTLITIVFVLTILIKNNGTRKT
jgi:hypothetical protein